MPTDIKLADGETLFQWHGSKPPATFASAPHGGPLITPDGFRGFAVRQDFQRGRLPIDQFIRGDKRFLEPFGFSPAELSRSSELGYFRAKPDEPPRKMTMLAQEMAVRAAGAEVLSPREGDCIAEWNYTEGGIAGRLIVMFKNGVLMSEERGRGDARPELMCAPAECLAAGELRTTSRTREENLARGNRTQQDILFSKGIRPAPVPRENLEMRDFLLGG